MYDPMSDPYNGIQRPAKMNPWSLALLALAGPAGAGYLRGQARGQQYADQQRQRAMADYLRYQQMQAQAQRAQTEAQATAAWRKAQQEHWNAQDAETKRYHDAMTGGGVPDDSWRPAPVDATTVPPVAPQMPVQSVQAAPAPPVSPRPSAPPVAPSGAFPTIMRPSVPMQTAPPDLNLPTQQMAPQLYQGFGGGRVQGSEIDNWNGFLSGIGKFVDVNKAAATYPYDVQHAANVTALDDAELNNKKTLGEGYAADTAVKKGTVGSRKTTAAQTARKTTAEAKTAEVEAALAPENARHQRAMNAIEEQKGRLSVRQSQQLLANEQARHEQIVQQTANAVLEGRIKKTNLYNAKHGKGAKGKSAKGKKPSEYEVLAEQARKSGVDVNTWKMWRDAGIAPGAQAAHTFDFYSRNRTLIPVTDQNGKVQRYEVNTSSPWRANFFDEQARWKSGKNWWNSETQQMERVPPKDSPEYARWFISHH